LPAPYNGSMDLFDQQADYPDNLLPHDGEVNYLGQVLSVKDADAYLSSLLSEIRWQHDRAVIFGKQITTRRKVAWYADEAFEYTYSNITRRAQVWNKELRMLKNKIEELTGETFNSCLLNLYHDGKDGMSWHSDGEADLKKNGAIASLSLGAERKFSFKHRNTKQTVSLILHHGSLLVMKGTTQSHWQHQLPKTKNIDNPRINLTFRTIVTN